MTINSLMDAVDVAIRLRSEIRNAIPGIDGKCRGNGCQCALCLADALGHRIRRLEEIVEKQTCPTSPAPN